MRLPLATYRLQLNNDFTLHHAREVVPYLAGLGITDLYLSPIFEARSNSTHGYDVTDPTRVRASIGGERALYQLAATARAHGLGILLDIVPNHMAVSSENAWWMNVLRHGRASQYAAFFDIYWSSDDRVLLPILGDDLPALIERGEIQLQGAAGQLVYHEHRLPLAPGTLRSGADLAELLEHQHYELVHWHGASRRIGYRRFFDITDLIGVRVEDPAVFDATHALIRRLAADDTIAGLRIDHIDGLRDPAGYLRRLREQIHGPDARPLYTVVEKILGADEKLPADWECEGTTGYEFLNLAAGLLIHPEGYARIETMYRRLTADDHDFNDVARDKRLLVMDRLFGGELARLAASLAQITGETEAHCAAAIRELTANLRVYRTYISSFTVPESDRDVLDATLSAAQQRDSSRTVFDVFRRLFRFAVSDRAAALDWIMRWQQFTGPVMAKGVEDTALYCHNAMLAANEVGADPARPCLDAGELIHALQERRARCSHALNATATHDTKRGEDTRARLAVLSEVPGEWRTMLRRWMREGDAWKADLADEEERVVADADVDSMLYQTLLGAWPLTGVDEHFSERIQQFMTKAVREAKEHTSWRQPNEDYEQALSAFVARLMERSQRAGLPEEIAAFAERLAPAGVINSLAQLLLKIAAPGVPDIYQGADLWSFTLVDPDNRQRVDFARRRRCFDDIAFLIDSPDRTRARELLEHWTDGRIKMLITATALRCRARHRIAFTTGDIVPLRVKGDQRDHVFAFAVRHGSEVLVAAVTRWSTALLDGAPGPRAPLVEAARWQDTRLVLPPAGDVEWRNIFTGAIARGDDIAAAELFADLPCALLEPLRDVVQEAHVPE